MPNASKTECLAQTADGTLLSPAVAARPSLATGAAVVKRYVSKLGNEAGVYRMISADGEPLYVGKAHNLRKRVTTYTRPDRLPIRLQRMVSETATMEFVTCASEVEALLLENNLIKRLMPRYNVLLRDDKTFPDILIRGDQDFPQIVKHRGARDRKGDFFGPFASAGAVNRTLNVLQRAFLLRNCAPLPAIPDQTLQRALCRLYLARRLCRHRGAGQSVPVWSIAGGEG